MYLYLNLTLKPPALVLVVHYLLLHVFIEKLILRHFPLWAPTIFKHIIIQSFFHWKHLYISICVQQYSIRGHSTYAVCFIWQSADLFKNTDAPVQGHLRCQVWASLWFSPPGLRPVTETNPLMTQGVRTEHLTAVWAAGTFISGIKNEKLLLAKINHRFTSGSNAVAAQIWQI